MTAPSPNAQTARILVAIAAGWIAAVSLSLFWVLWRGFRDGDSGAAVMALAGNGGQERYGFALSAALDRLPVILAHLGIAALGLAIIAFLGRRIKIHTSALAESESRLRLLLATLPDSVFHKDLQGRFVSVNPAAERIFGRPMAEWIGKTDREVLPPDLADEIEAEDRRILRDGLSLRALRRVPGAGGERWVEVAKSPTRDMHGRITGLVGIARDVTSRIKADQALVAAEAKFRRVVEQSLVGICIARGRRLVYWNPRFLEIFGYTADEAAGLTLGDFIADDDRRRIEELLSSNGRDEDDAFRASLQGKMKTGEPIELEMHGSQIEFEEQPAYLAVLLDVTRRKRLEEDLWQARKMEAIGQLAGGVAHDFNNLLQAIVGYTQLALAELPASSQAKTDIEEALRAAERAAALTEQLLTFSRKKTGRKIEMSLADLVRDSMRMIRRIIEPHIQIDLALQDDLPAIHADPSQVEVILMNLCSNARDAMPDGGNIVIAVSSLDIKERFFARQAISRSGRHVVLRVSDTGPGMDQATIGRIFEPFYTTKPPGRGTGLGLATVYGIVQQHDGFIHVYSVPGRGTSFRIYFRALGHPAAPKPQEPALRAQGGSETVLVADDEAPVRNLISRILADAGYRVFAASDGEDALRLFNDAEGMVDLALLSSSLSKLNGPALSARLRQARPGLRTMFVATCDGEAPPPADGQKRTPIVLRKPCDPGALLRAVRETLDGDGMP